MNINVQINDSNINNPTFIFNAIDIDEDVINENYIINSDSEGLSKFNNIEFLRKPNLTKRNKDIIDKIANYHKDNYGIDVSRLKTIILKSWNGEGKTTIAIEHAYKFGKNYVASFWIDTSKSIVEQYCQIATDVFKIVIPTNVSKEDANKFLVESVKYYINNHSVLLIFDNVDQIDDIKSFLPKKGYSRTIVITTNFTITQEDYFENLEINKLEEKDALNILLNNLKPSDDDIENAKLICSIFENSPFALELSNNYLKEFPDLNLGLFIEDIKNLSIKWDGLIKTNNFSFYNTSPSIIALIEKRINKLDPKNDIDNLSMVVLTAIGCMHVAKDEFKYDILQKGIGLEEKIKDNLQKFNKVKNRLLELGLAFNSESKFVVHSIILEYLKHFYIQLNVYLGYLNFKIFESKKMNQEILGFGFWILNDINESVDRMFTHLFDKFEITESKDVNICISLLLNHVENLYFNSSDKECLQYIDKALVLNNLDINFKYYETRRNDLYYHKALSLHRLGNYNDSLEIYELITSKDAPMSTPIQFINSFNYIGHIYKNKGDFENAKFYYEKAGKNNSKYFEQGYINEFSYKVHEIRTLIFLTCLFETFNFIDQKLEIQTNLADAKRELLKFAPENVKSMNDKNHHKYPIEIGMLILQGCSDRPECILLPALTVENSE